MKQFIKDNAKDILGTVAPVLGTAIGGPMGGIAARAISQKLLGKPSATAEELSNAIVNADPNTLAELKKIEADFLVQMERIGVDLEKIAADDRNSARQREMEIKDKTPAILAYGTMAAFFSYIGGVTFFDLPTADMDFIYLALGWLGGTASTVVAYYFGSSSGSAKKDDYINKTIKR